jgi:hypothetical protein
MKDSTWIELDAKSGPESNKEEPRGARAKDRGGVAQSLSQTNDRNRQMNAMQTSYRRLWGWISSLFLLLAIGQAGAQPLAQLQFDIVGIKLAVDPPALTVPKDIPTFVNAQLTLPAGIGPEAQGAIRELAQGAAVLAELRGPALTPTTISALPGQLLNLPPLHLPGDYFLDNIRLVKNGTVLLAGAPAVVPIRVISDILISSVTTRELSLEEIQQRGIVIDASSFRALEFQAAFVIDGLPVTITFPVLLPQASQLPVPGRAPQDLASAIQLATEQQQRQQVELPPELDRPGLNLYVGSRGKWSQDVSMGSGWGV